MVVTQVPADYLCSPQSNVYDIDFTRFRIRDTESGKVLFEVAKPSGRQPATILSPVVADEEKDQDNGSAVPSPDQDPDSCRFVRYQFPAEFLDLKTVGATIEFTVGQKAINKFRMIERHFFRDIHLKTFDFSFGFCIPQSSNSCEHIYEFPAISNQMSE